MTKRPAGARSGRWRKIWAWPVDAGALDQPQSRSAGGDARRSDAATQADIAAELKRLRREHEISRQERDILKRATAFLAREESR